MNPSAPLVARILVTVIGAVFVVFGVFHCIAQPRDPGAAMGLLLSGAFAALPWVALDRPNPARGVLGAVVSLAVFLYALLPLQPGRAYPLSCDPVDFACQIENVLHGIGGTPLAVVPPLLVAVVLLVHSVRTFRADLRAARSEGR